MYYVQTFMVDGSDEFPFIMLKRDRCYPMDATSARELVSSEERCIYLKRVTFLSSDMPSVSEWDEKWWKVSGVQTTEVWL